MPTIQTHVYDPRIAQQAHNLHIEVTRQNDAQGRPVKYIATDKLHGFSAEGRTETDAIRACEQGWREKVTTEGPAAL